EERRGGPDRVNAHAARARARGLRGLSAGPAWDATGAGRSPGPPLGDRLAVRLHLLHVVGARRPGVARGQAAQGADEGDELPDLGRRDLAAPRRHTARPALADGGEDAVGAADLDP